MSEQQQVEKLEVEIKEVLGLDELESKIYLTLLKTNPVTGSTIAKNLDLDRAGVYRAVEKMIEKKLVMSTISTPRMLTPVDPKTAIKTMVKKKQDRITKIKESGQKIIQKINHEISSNKETDIPTFKVVQGTESIYTEIAEIIESCQDVVYVATNLQDLKQMCRTIIPEKVQICQNNGGNVFLLVEGDKEDVLTFSQAFKAKETRLCKLPSNGRIVVCKDIKMIMSDSTWGLNNSVMDYSVSTTSKDMIDHIDNLCKIIWKSKKSKKLQLSSFL